MAVAKFLLFATLAASVVIGVWDHRRKSQQFHERYADYSARPFSPFRVENVPELGSLKPFDEKSDKRAAVTGAAGMLGGNLVEALLEDGWNVIALHRKSSDLTALFDLQAKFGNKLSLTIADINDPGQLQGAIPEGLPVVFHVAAVVGSWFKLNNRMYRSNVLGTRAVVDVCLKQRVGRLVYTSTIAALQHNHPTDTPISGSDPLYALNAWAGYDQTKALAELEVREGIADGLFATTINPAGILGQYDQTSVSHGSPSLTRPGFARAVRMLKKGEMPALSPSTISFDNVKIVARAHVQAAKKGRCGANYVLGGGPKYNWKQLAGEIGARIHVNTDLPILPAAILRPAGVFMDFVSLFTGKEPTLTVHANAPATSDTLQADLANIMTLPEYAIDVSPAVNELGYDPNSEMSALPVMVGEMIGWLEKHNKL